MTNIEKPFKISAAHRFARELKTVVPSRRTGKIDINMRNFFRTDKIIFAINLSKMINFASDASRSVLSQYVY